MCEIWANSLLPKALKSCPESNKSPNLVTLFTTPTPDILREYNLWTFSDRAEMLFAELSFAVFSVRQ